MRSKLQNRVQIQRITPSVDCGRYAVKAIISDEVVVEADIFREGHEKVAAAIRYRGPGDQRWREAPLEFVDNDRWRGAFTVDAIGPWRYGIIAWTDHFATWLDALVKKHAAGRTELDLELEEGARLLARRAKKAPAAERSLISAAAELLRSDAPLADKVTAVRRPDLGDALARHPERLDATISRPDLPLWTDREAARFSAWYEMFPRSEGATSRRSGTLAHAAKRLADVAEMGFDVVYLPPIHPIGPTKRKGRNNALEAKPHDPGVPWAIGGPEGGHTAIHPNLGTIDDFDDFVVEAQRNGLEVALDYAIQCSPDHPWVSEHPEWFRHRADGSIAYAENPPKEYQDIYPLDFDTEDQQGLWNELKRVVDYWISHNVKIYRVDNPHTKALPFWEWLIAEVHAQHPDVVFLAEAFTRPKMMQTLAKLGFTQSYTYFAWRNTKQELIDYVTELAHGEMAKYYRPNFWPNTPDILTAYLQQGGRPAFKTRLVLAALLSPAYGIYSGYELCENVAVRPGSEEYVDSEKYQYRPRDWNQPDSLARYIGRVNDIRRSHRAFRELGNVWFHHIDNPQMLCFSKVGPQRSDAVLTVVNLDPLHPQEATTWLDMWQLGLEHHSGPFEAHDLLTDTTYIWHGPANYVRLDPSAEPAHVLHLRPL